MADKSRFYAATVGKDARHIITKYKTGIEIDNYCISEMLDNKHELFKVRQIMKITDRHILHGPFTELHPASIDPKARKFAYDRLQQAYDVCSALEINHMVVHSGYLPFVYFKSWQTERSVEFWQEFMADKPAWFNIYIENVLEDEPYMMRDMMDRISDDRIHICIDIGHANVAGNTDITEWIKVLGSYTGHIHLHNNNGKADEHNSFDKGTLDIARVLECIDTYCRDDVTVTVEAYDLEASFKWLYERGYI